MVDNSTLRDMKLATRGVTHGTYEGVANIVGAPVDAMNSLLSMVGWGSKNPFGGSEHIKGAMTSALNWYYDDVVPFVTGEEAIKPQTETEATIYNVSHIVGETAGMSISGAGLIKATSLKIAANLAPLNASQSRLLTASPAATATIAGVVTAAAVSTATAGTPDATASASQDLGILKTLLDPNLKHAEDSSYFAKGGASKALQEALKSKGALTDAQVDGTVGRITANAVNKVVRQDIDPAKLTDAQKTEITSQMKELAKEIKDHPASQYHQDPRVMAFQACAYSLGMTNEKN